MLTMLSNKRQIHICFQLLKKSHFRCTLDWSNLQFYAMNDLSFCTQLDAINLILQQLICLSKSGHVIFFRIFFFCFVKCSYMALAVPRMTEVGRTTKKPPAFQMRQHLFYLQYRLSRQCFWEFVSLCLILLQIAISYGHKFVFVFDNVLWHMASKTKTKTSQEYTASASYNFLTCFMEGLNMFLSLHSNIHI